MFPPNLMLPMNSRIYDKSVQLRQWSDVNPSASFEYTQSQYSKQQRFEWKKARSV